MSYAVQKINKILWHISLVVVIAHGADESCEIVGVGTSSVAELFNMAFRRFQRNRTVSFDYDRKSPESAFAAFADVSGSRYREEYDFLVGERFAQIDAGSYYPDLVKIPLLSEALVIVFNLPGVRTLNLTVSALSQIFFDEKDGPKYWNDTRIQRENPGVKLPGERIIPIVRAKGSGQTRSIMEAFGVADKFMEAFEKFMLTFRKSVAATAAEMASAVSVVANSIGYVDLSTARAENLSYISEFKETSKENHLIKMSLYEYTNSSITTFVNLVFNQTRIQSDCCKARELIGFIYFLASDGFAQETTTNLRFGLLPPDKLASLHKRIQSLECGGKNMLSEYFASLQPKSKNSELKTALFWSIAGLLLLLAVGLIGRKLRRRHRNKIAEEKFWLISGQKLKLLDLSKTVYGQQTLSPYTRDRQGRRFNSSRLQFTMTIGMLEDATVFVDLMEGLRNPRKWGSKTRAMVASLRREISNSHVLGFHGIVGYDDRVLCVMEFCGKGTLHHVITTAKHEINDAIKFNLALDVADGMNYLQKKQITHGMLNSLTCYIDFKWTVKISNWLDHTVHSSENSAAVANKFTKQEFSENMENIILLIYAHPNHLAGGTTCSTSDTYSFGLLLVEIFTRELPFALDTRSRNSRRSYRSIIEAKREGRFDVPELTAAVPTVVNKLVRKCICTNQLDFAAILKILRSQAVARKGVADIMMEAIQKYADNLEEKVAERTAELNALNGRMQELLHELLPPEIATRFLNGQSVEPEFFECVSVSFLDVCGITSVFAVSTPVQAMSMMNQLWLALDEVIAQFDAYKINTVGDTCMICSGLPTRNGVLHVKHVCELAQAVLERLKTLNVQHTAMQQVKLRIGISSGPVTAGIVGNKMPQYCLFGDAVNTAARMEQASLPLHVHLSHAAAELIRCNFPAQFSLSLRGDIDVKGVGTMKTYWLR